MSNATDRQQNYIYVLLRQLQLTPADVFTECDIYRDSVEDLSSQEALEIIEWLKSELGEE